MFALVSNECLIGAKLVLNLMFILLNNNLITIQIYIANILSSLNFLTLIRLLTLSDYQLVRLCTSSTHVMNTLVMM